MVAKLVVQLSRNHLGRVSAGGADDRHHTCVSDILLMPRTHCNDHTEQSLSNALDLLLDLNLSGLGVAQHNVAGTRVGRLPSIALRDQPPWEQREKVGGRNDKV